MKLPTLPPPTKTDVADAMLTHGGSFVRALSECLRLADETNLQRIREAFPDYWAKYYALAAAMKALNP